MVNKKKYLGYLATLLFVILTGIFHNTNEIFYYILFFLTVYFLIKSKNNIITAISVFLLLFISMFWTSNVIGIKFVLPFLLIYLLYLSYFLFLVSLKEKYTLLLIIIFPLIEFIIISFNIFPPLLISYPINGLFFNKFTIGFYGVLLVFSTLLFIVKTSHRGLYYVLITLFILLLIPARHLPENNLKILKPNIDKKTSTVKYLNSLKGYDGVILPEYYFRRDFQKDKNILRAIFKSYFENNGFLAFGFTKNRNGKIESWGAILTKDKSLFVRKKHPVIFLEPRYRKLKPFDHKFIYKGHVLKLFVCQDIYFPDVQSQIKKGDILIAPSYIPKKWHFHAELYLQRER